MVKTKRPFVRMYGKTQKKLECAGRKPLSTTFEEKLFDWMLEILEKKGTVLAIRWFARKQKN